MKTLIRFAFLAALLASIGGAQTNRYVSLSGSDSTGDGTSGNPWRTIKHACNSAQSNSGDTIYIHPGVYDESSGIDIYLSDLTLKQWSSTDPVVVDVAHDFPIGSTWTQSPTYTNCYYAPHTGYGSGTPYAYVTSGFGSYRNSKVGLVPYTNINDLNSNETKFTSTSAFYVGPGVYHDTINGYIYIRLDPTPEVTAYGNPFSGSSNPGSYAISVSTRGYVFAVRGSGVAFEGLTINQAQNPIDLKNGADDLTVKNCVVWLGDTCIEADETDADGASDGVMVNGCELLGDNPYWVSWGDAKNGLNAPADKMRQTSVNFGSADIHNATIRNCFLFGGHDGIGCAGDGVVIENNAFDAFHDDCIEIEGAYEDIEIRRNMFRNSFVAASIGQGVPSSSEIGPVLMHHNIVSFMQLTFTRRDKAVGQTTEQVGSWASGPYGSQYILKIEDGTAVSAYNNTFAMLDYQDGEYGISRAVSSTSGGNAENTMITNNLFMVINDQMKRTYTPAGSPSNHKIDGNLYWKPGASSGYYVGQDGSTQYSTLPINTSYEVNGYIENPNLTAFDTGAGGKLVITGSAPNATVAKVDWEPQDFTPESGSRPLNMGVQPITVAGIKFTDYEVYGGAITSATTPAFWTSFPFTKL